MKPGIILGAIVLALSSRSIIGQSTDQRSEQAPIYRVTVVERTMKAVNYRYRSGPTTIDFRGTVLLPKARGEAVVESRRGRTEIDAKLENITPPTRFGREYLTYVLWAISPEGRPHNLGEIIPNGGNKATLRVTTDLQAFGLIVTAEPYSAVRRPSDVVVAENQVREDTIGKIEQVEAKYELMPRGQYTWRVSDSLEAEVAKAPKVSMSKYEALSELYQAQNAVGIARAANAERYAPNTFAKAQQLLNEAQQLQAGKAENGRVVESAREAAQTAEDARVLAQQRQQEEKLNQASDQVSAAERAKAVAEAAAQAARAETSAAQAQAEAERAARQRAEADAAAARDRAAQAQAQAQATADADRATAAASAARQRYEQDAVQRTEFRRQLLEQLNGVAATRDTPRGLVVTIPDRDFSAASLRAPSSEQLARIAVTIASHPGLRVEVDGHSDNESTQALSSKRAEAVRDVLAARGLPSGVLSVRAVGDAQPLVSNATESGRKENRRVEIVISGDPIGNLPFWDRTYNLTAGERR